MADEHGSDDEPAGVDNPLRGVDPDRREFLKKMAGVAGVFAVPTVVAVTLDDSEAGAQVSDSSWLYDDEDRGILFYLRRLLHILRRIFGGFGR
ncbi:MAG: hypothetical protein RIE08_02375 [Acidimicrobiales bacterium]